MGNNLFDDFLSNKSPVKVDNAYEIKDKAKRLIGLYDKVFKDIKSLDPKKAEYYAKLALLPNPIKILRDTNDNSINNRIKRGDFDNKFPDDLINTPKVSDYERYNAITSDMINYIKKSKDIKELPFKGRDSIESYSLDDLSLWDLSLKKHGDTDSSIPENPLFGLTGSYWLPATEFELNYDTIKNYKLQLPNNIDISIPRHKRKTPTISMNLIDNNDNILRKYFKDYKNAMIDSNGKVLPYKEATSELTIYIISSEKKIKYKRIFYVIPEYDFIFKGAKDSVISEIRGVNFNVLGEVIDDTYDDSPVERLELKANN